MRDDPQDLMDAVRWTGRRELHHERLSIPQPAPDEALVRVAWVGLCGSDLEEYLEGPVVVAGPVALGHEISGVVERSAADGSGPRAGTKVVVDVVTGCGRCYWCLHHEEGLCGELAVIGQHSDGGLAEFVAARADRLIALPDGLTLRQGALAEAASVAFRAVRKLGRTLGLQTLVIGGGTIGLLTAQVLQHSGASVQVLEPSSARRDTARSLGLQAIWADSAQERRVLLKADHAEPGLSAVIECTGVDGTVQEALELVGRGGTVLALGVTARAQPIDVTAMVLAEKHLIGSAAHMWDDDVAPAVELLASGALDVDPLITHEVALSDAIEAFELMAGRSEAVLKVLVAVDRELDR